MGDKTMSDYKQQLKEDFLDLMSGYHLKICKYDKPDTNRVCEDSKLELLNFISTKLDEVEAKAKAEERLKYEVQQSITTGDGTGLTLDNLEKGLAKR